MYRRWCSEIQLTPLGGYVGSTPPNFKYISYELYILFEEIRIKYGGRRVNNSCLGGF